jgi:long-chain fatty acid transport protein
MMRFTRGECGAENAGREVKAMKSFVKAIGLLALTGTVSVAAIATAQAGAFGLNEYGAAGTALAGAGAAAGGAGLGSITFNPATLTDFSGAWASQTFTYIRPSIFIHSPFGNSNDIANGGRLDPAGQNVYQVNDHLWLGLSLIAPFGLVTEVNPQHYASFYGRSTSVFNVSAVPSVAYKVNDWLSIGGGVQIGYINARLSSNLSPLVPGSAFSLEGHDYTAGFVAGVTLKPLAGTEIGVGYRSQVHPSLEHGTEAVNIPIQGVSGVILPGFHTGKTDLTLPDQVTASVRQVVTDAWTVDFTYQWTHWSVFKNFMIDVDGRPGVPLNFDYRDGWLIGGGAEYRWNSQLTLRGGLNYEQSPVTDRVRSVNLPDSNRIMLGLGGSYQINSQMSVDVAFAHVFHSSAPINLTSPLNPNFTGVPFYGHAVVETNMIALTGNYHFGAPPPVVIAKY